MSNIIASYKSGNEIILIELEDTSQDPYRNIFEERNQAQKVSEKMKRNFDSVWNTLKQTSHSFSKNLGEIREKASNPNEISVEFGLKFSADAGVIIAKAGAEAHFKVSLKWNDSK